MMVWGTELIKGMKRDVGRLVDEVVQSSGKRPEGSARHRCRRTVDVRGKR